MRRAIGPEQIVKLGGSVAGRFVMSAQFDQAVVIRPMLPVWYHPYDPDRIGSELKGRLTGGSSFEGRSVHIAERGWERATYGLYSSEKERFSDILPQCVDEFFWDYGLTYN